MAKSRKPSIFKELRDQLAIIAPNLTGRVACPICLRLFDERDYADGRLTNGHVIPKAVGAKPVTLLCSDCNGRCARQDKHLADYVRVMFGARPGAKVKAVAIDVGGHRISGSLKRNPPGARDPYTITLVAAGSNITTLKLAADYLRPWGKKEIVIHWGFEPRLVNVAFLASAYLAAFRLRGYWYILNTNLDPIREQILQPDSDRLVGRAVRDWDLGTPRSGLLRLVSLPESAQCFAFSMFGKTALLPKAEDRTGAVYNSTAKYLAAPFSEFQFIAENVRGGRVDLEMEARTFTKTVSFAHPDIATVRRLDPKLPLNLDWIKTAPTWAAPLVTP